MRQVNGSWGSRNPLSGAKKLIPSGLKLAGDQREKKRGQKPAPIHVVRLVRAGPALSE
jgi:hypothetical protein